MNVIRDLAIFTVLFNSVFCQVELKIKKGIIKGQLLKSRYGRPFYSYTSIPYAKPPIEELRLKAPEPVEPWDGILSATKESNACLQLGGDRGSEDCLYLNVYSPKTDGTLLPVMVWIHGGGFSIGTSSSYGPEFFMDKDVVLVTINYRLGVLGFLSAEDDVIPGNFGMKDQVEALRWVKENIIYFNGDAGQVTIFGQSAGAASAGFHMLSPMSKGLFHKAILQSGVPVCWWAIPPPGVPRKRAFALATIASCHVNTSEDVLSCLRKLPAQYLMDVQERLFTWLTLPGTLFSPVVENCNATKESFLCRHPLYDFKQESFVPVIVGINTAEGGLFVSNLYKSTGLKHPEFRTDFNRLMSITTDYNYYTKPEYIDDIGTRILKKYFPRGGIETRDLSAVKMFTDAAFGHCIFDMEIKLSSPVYSYIYGYQNLFSFNILYGWKGKPLGVTHGDELNSLFKLKTFNPLGLRSKNDEKVSKLMVNIWSKFVSSKIPTIDGMDNGTVWPEFISINSSLLKIDSFRPKIIKNPLVDMYNFWKELPITQ